MRSHPFVHVILLLVFGAYCNIGSPYTISDLSALARQTPKLTTLFETSQRVLLPYKAIEGDPQDAAAMYRAARFVWETLVFDHIEWDGVLIRVGKAEATDKLGGPGYKIMIGVSANDVSDAKEYYEVPEDLSKILQHVKYGASRDYFEVWPNAGINGLWIGDRQVFPDTPYREIVASLPGKPDARLKFRKEKDGRVAKYEGAFFAQDGLGIAVTSGDWGDYWARTGEQRVFYIESSSDDCVTARGIRVGDAKSDVVMRYGRPLNDRYVPLAYWERAKSLPDARARTLLLFFFDDDSKVERIATCVLPEKGAQLVKAGGRMFWGVDEWTVEKTAGVPLALPSFAWADTLRIVGDPLERDDWIVLNSAAFVCYSLRLGNGQKEIPDAAFFGNNKLLSFNAPEVTKVGKSAFEAAFSLTEAVLPRMEKVGARAFNWCSMLWELDFSQIVSIDDRAFENSGIDNVFYTTLFATFRIERSAMKGNPMCASMRGTLDTEARVAWFMIAATGVRYIIAMKENGGMWWRTERPGYFTRPRMVGSSCLAPYPLMLSLMGYRATIILYDRKSVGRYATRTNYAMYV